MLSRRGAPLTRKEKSFFVVTTLICAGLVVCAYLSATPQFDVTDPTPLPAQNAYTHYAAVEVAMKTAKAPVDATMDDYAIYRTPEERAWLYSIPRRKAWLKTNAKVGTSLQKAQRLPYRFPIKHWEDMYIVRPAVSIRYISWYKSVEVRTCFAQGALDKALNCALDLVEMAGQFTIGGIEWGRSNETGLLSAATEMAREYMENVSLADLRKATRKLKDLNQKREPYEQTLKDWRNRDLSHILHFMAGTSIVSNDDTLLERVSLWRHYYCYPYGGTRENTPAEEVALYGFSKRTFIEEVDRTFAAARNTGKEPFRVNSLIPHTWYLRDLETGLEEFHLLEARNLARRRMLLVAFALQTFKKQHGRFPRKLSELSPGILKSLPADPFSLNKSSFAFKSTDNDYLLYSVGKNNRDNAGKKLSQYSESFKFQHPETKDWDDMVFDRQSKLLNHIPAGAKPKKPGGSPPVFMVTPSSSPASPLLP